MPEAVPEAVPEAEMRCTYCVVLSRDRRLFFISRNALLAVCNSCHETKTCRRYFVSRSVGFHAPTLKKRLFLRGDVKQSVDPPQQPELQEQKTLQLLFIGTCTVVHTGVRTFRR